MKLEKAIYEKRKKCVEKIGGNLLAMRKILEKTFTDMRDDYNREEFENFPNYRKLINTSKYLAHKNIEDFHNMEKETENMKKDLEDGASEDAVEQNNE